MDEREFVRFLKRRFPFHHGVGIGDDASLVRHGDHYQLITQDILIEDVHFRLTDISLPDLAMKALAVNLSDIAAMGGLPEYFYLGLGYPERLGPEELKRFFSGIKKGCRRWGVELAGGDFSRSGQLFIAISMVGRARRPVRRSGARAGDWIGITGPTGESALGLKLLLGGFRDDFFIRRHRIVRPAVAAGQILAGCGVNAMIDVSDGLLLDLERILEASAIGAEIEYRRLPVSARLKNRCRRVGVDERELVLAGGEDYVLLFTVSPAREKRLRQTGLRYHLIGRIVSGKALRVNDGGRPLCLKRHGFDHFQEPPEVGRR